MCESEPEDSYFCDEELSFRPKRKTRAPSGAPKARGQADQYRRDQRTVLRDEASRMTVRLYAIPGIQEDAARRSTRRYAPPYRSENRSGSKAVAARPRANKTDLENCYDYSGLDWRPRPELNWCKRFCRPLRNHSATWPHRGGSIQTIKHLGNLSHPLGGRFPKRLLSLQSLAQSRLVSRRPAQHHANERTMPPLQSRPHYA